MSDFPGLPTELAEAMLGSLFIAIGVALTIAGLAARPQRNMSAVWMGFFCFLYGARLAAKSMLVQAVAGWSPIAFDYIDAGITYAVLVPGGLFVETVVGPGRYHLVRRMWQVTCLYAIGGVANDLLRGVPYASMWLNAPVVLGTLSIQLGHVIARARANRWTVESRAVAITGAIVTVVAIRETLSDEGFFGGPLDVEPFATLLFMATLGWLLLKRARDQTFRFVALSRELELARTIQQSLLPHEMPVVSGLGLHGAYLPMSQVAGDFYDVIVRADGRVLIIVADVSGHGVPAALVASMVKVAFASEAEREARPGDILSGINRALTGKFDHAYVTACCALIDRAQQTFAYAAAGHPPAMLRRRDGRLERIEEGGLALTWLPAVAYTTVDVVFEPGDRLLLFTDGLLESARAEDEFFGDRELARVVAALPAQADASAAVLAAHRAWIGSETLLTDDVTLVVVDCD